MAKRVEVNEEKLKAVIEAVFYDCKDVYRVFYSSEGSCRYKSCTFCPLETENKFLEWLKEESDEECQD